MKHRVLQRAMVLASLSSMGCSWEWDRFSSSTTVDASTDLGGAMDAADGSAPCATDEECARTSGDRPVCDAVTGRCVACTPTRDVCGAGRYCGAGNTCAAGCSADQGCAGAIVDGGVADAGVSLAATRCDTVAHACVQCLVNEHCPIGTRCVDHACLPGCDAARGCPAGRTCCGGGCVDIATDSNNCGACGGLCSTVNGLPACAASRCGVGRCNDPFGDCDGDPSTGCETNTRTSVANCGRCGTACVPRANATAACSEGACAYTCATGFGDCDGAPANGCEVDLARTLTNCGRCGSVCSFAGGVGACVGGVCTRTACATGRGDCDGNTTNGCEVDLQGDPANCRVCGATCSFARATALCVSGGCAIGRCEMGFDNCDLVSSNGCETDINTSLAHCGACGRSCAFPRAGATCMGGVCAIGACIAGAANCDGSPVNGCEVDLNTSAANCGRCGGTCPARPNAVASCAAGSCGFTCATGFGDCDRVAANGCEVSTNSSVTACGACGVTCAPPNAVGACRGGLCAVASCLPGFADCDGNPANGCELDVQSSSTDCGACGRACSPVNGVGACVGGACTLASCATGYADCDGLASTGCETQPVSDRLHCGACGNACVSGRSCEGGRCALPTFAGYTVGTSPTTVVWVDACTAPGAIQTLVAADDQLVRGTLEFPVEFWGTTNFTYFVSSNGWVGFGDYYGNATSIPNQTPYGHFGTLPRAGTPYPAAFVFGVDLVQGTRGVCVATLGVAPGRRFVVQSTGATLYASTSPDGVSPPPLPTSTFSYELIAYEGSGILDMVFNTPFSGPGAAPMISQTNVTVGLQDYRMPLTAAVFTGTVTGATRVRYTPR